MLVGIWRSHARFAQYYVWAGEVRVQVPTSKIAANSDLGTCAARIGSDGAGHFVKMVHNGIEYGDMQLIAESYDMLSRGLHLAPEEISQVFKHWNDGPLESYLIEITSVVLSRKDKITGEPLVDRILDVAEQNGTGRWTVQIVPDLEVPIPILPPLLSRERFEELHALAAQRLAPPKKPI